MNVERESEKSYRDSDSVLNLLIEELIGANVNSKISMTYFGILVLSFPQLIKSKPALIEVQFLNQERQKSKGHIN